MKGSQKVIDALNGLLAMELAAMDQYFIHSQMYQDWGLHSDDGPYAECNRAHPSLMYPGQVPADAWITLTNLSPEGRLSFGLPPYQMLNLVRYVDGGMLPGAMVLDTIAVDVPNMEVQLTWRLPIALNADVRVLEFRMEQNAEKTAS